MRRLFAKGLSKAEIARRVGIGRTSVRRLLAQPTALCPIFTRLCRVPFYAEQFHFTQYS
ncbi:MAG TPA: helix-turn-helix domain-containing protein [Candidatus Binatia bacterium]